MFLFNRLYIWRFSEALIERCGRVKTIEQGAATTVWAAVGKDLDGKGALYLEDCVVSVEKNDMAEIFKNMFGYMSYAVNPESVNKLWDLLHMTYNQTYF